MASAYYNRALAYKCLKDYKEFQVDIAKTLEIDPKYKAAYVVRGNVSRDLEEYQ